MFLSMNWIKDFVDLSGLDELELINKFSLATAEVENDILFKGKDLEGIVVAQIKDIQNHPESEKLHLLKVDIGEDELVDVVCGAPNVRLNMKTSFAKLGAKIGDITITPRKLAGYTSNGMCCSEKELGLSDDNSGIMDITEDVKVGTSIKDIWDVDDIIFEVDNKSLTNRPDLWSHYGIAREFSAISGRPLKNLELDDLSKYDSLEKIDVKIEDPLCQRYSSIKVKNINRNVSPMNMKIRLFYCGMRAINFLADLTNYMMLEIGQPMHAFDSRKVEKIRIKRFDKPFTFTTLDNVDRNIDENTLMICNDNTPVAIAGIMGGLDSEIVDDTTSLTLESATFDAASIRKSTVRLNHRTDSSIRYEKSLDPELTTIAIARFLKLLKEYDENAEVISSLTDEYAFHYEQITLSFDKAYVDKYTGIEIDNDTIVDTLTKLGFTCQLNGNDFTVVVPSWRATKDVTIKADIIEEITRIYGYDNFDIHTSVAPLYPTRPDEAKKIEDIIKDLLVKRFSLHEVHSYIWNYYDELKELGIKSTGKIKLINATNPNIETIRESMIPTQLCQINTNIGYDEEFGIFEVGRVIEDVKDNLCVERKKLGITLYSKTDNFRDLYFYLKEIVEVMIDEINHSSVSFKEATPTQDFIHPVNYNKIYVDNKELGYIGAVYPTVLNNIDKRSNIVFCEIDIDALSKINNKSITYKEPSKFPGIEIDLSFISDNFLPIKNAIDNTKSELINKVEVTDIYEGEDTKSITVRIHFSHPDKTLKREEVTEITDKIINTLKAQNIELKG